MFKWAATGLLLLFLSSPSHAEMSEDICGVPSENSENPFPHRNIELEDRLHLIDQMHFQTKRNYSLAELKRERLGVELEKVFADCKKQEKQNQLGDPLRFKDRLRICMAKFQDTHFQIDSLEKDPRITLGFGVREIKGRYYIAYRHAKMLKFVDHASAVSGNIDSLFSLGAEIVEVEGQPLSEYAKQFEKYIAASSQGYLKEEALDAVFLRGFAYPNKRTLQVGVVDGSGQVVKVELPWWFRATGPSLAMNVLQKRGFCSQSLVQVGFDAKADSFVDQSTGFEGYQDWDSVKDILEKKVYLNKDAEEILVMGFGVPQKDQSFCYLKINSFNNAETLSLQGGDDSKASFKSVLEGYLLDCENRKLGLILDLRLNGGGNPQLAIQLMGLLTPAGTTLPNRVEGYLNSSLNRAILDRLSSGQGVDGFISTLGEPERDLYSRMASNARNPSEKYAGFVKLPDFGSSHEKGVFTQPVVALVTPQCVSACDGMAGLLKTTKRGKLVGTHSNGTGAGFTSSAPFSSVWQDQNFQLVKLKIPNYLWGTSAESSAGELKSFAQVRDSIAENRPVIADITYRTSLEDLKTGGKGWIATAVSALYGESANPTQRPVSSTELKPH